MLTTPLFGALGIAAWSKFYAKHNTRVSFVYFVAMFIVVWLLMMMPPKARVRDEQKGIDGFSVTGSGAP